MNGVVGYLLLNSNEGITKTAATKGKALDTALKATQMASGVAGTLGTGILAASAYQGMKNNKNVQKNQEELRDMQLALMQEQAAKSNAQDQVLPGQQVPLSQNYAPDSEFKVASDNSENLNKEASERDTFDEYLDSIVGVDESDEGVEKTAEDNTQEEFVQSKEKIKIYTDEEKENIISDVLEKKAHFTNMNASDILKESKMLREQDDEVLQKEAEYWNGKLLDDELNVAEPHNKNASFNDNKAKTSDDLFAELIDKMKKYKNM